MSQSDTADVRSLISNMNRHSGDLLNSSVVPHWEDRLMKQCYGTVNGRGSRLGDSRITKVTFCVTASFITGSVLED